MSDVPLGEVCPDLTVDVDAGEYVTGVIAFVILESAESHVQHVQWIATDGMPGITMRGLVEIGRAMLIDDQNARDEP